MSGELIGAGVGLIVALLVGAAGWFGRQQYGAERERRRQAEEDRDAAEARVEQAGKPPASRSEASGILRSRLARLVARRQRMRDEAADRRE